MEQGEISHWGQVDKIESEEQMLKSMSQWFLAISIPNQMQVGCQQKLRKPCRACTVTKVHVPRPKIMKQIASFIDISVWLVLQMITEPFHIQSKIVGINLRLQKNELLWAWGVRFDPRSTH